ncbi:transcriptional regulator [Xenorhabdus mauleonii]|uniref:Helix-turn-helix n=1 Tax=Xenorhabdus mauleonii TaxID=351675 RepID=A0A1I3V538_9GAMM|nr:helix-turn-helix transcriptional regulator [Xenorhabdus mauleonii]PHM37602.1 transcriptional regulator [Xenorhabdus mauleonii]SFJ89466.1 Helix-turn-helix [Xenorhabdus mauleonii]
MNPHRLLSARTAKGLTQSQLGEKLGVEDSEKARLRIYRYEKGLVSPTYEVACRMADILDVPACYFYIEDDVFSERVLNLHKKNNTYNELENSLVSVLKENQNKKEEYEEALKKIKVIINNLTAL